MKTKIKIFFLLFLLFGVMAAKAAPITLLPLAQEGLWNKIARCGWHISCYFSPVLGASITTINGSDTLTNSRVTINTNFTSLNNYKIENSSSSISAITTLPNLVSIGTITTGVWSASTLTVGEGGTGSTTLASNLILLGNGTGNIGVVNGTGATGQFLTSQGSGASPHWTTSSIDTSLNYTWTGTHTFNGSTFTVNGSTTTLNSATTTINNSGYVFPASPNASGTVLMINNSPPNVSGGVSLFWEKMGWDEIAETVSAGSLATSTVSNLPARKFYLVDFYVPSATGGTLYMEFNNDGGSTLYAGRISSNGGADVTATSKGNFQIESAASIGSLQGGTHIVIFINNSSDAVKTARAESEVPGASAATAPDRSEAIGSWYNSASINTITITTTVTANTMGGGTRMTVYGSKN